MLLQIFYKTFSYIKFSEKISITNNTKTNKICEKIFLKEGEKAKYLKKYINFYNVAQIKI